MTVPVIRKARPEDADAVGDVLAAAFDDYAWTTWALGDTDRHDRLRALYRLHAGLVGGEAGTTWVAEVDGRIVAAASWTRPDAPPPSSETVALLTQEMPRLLGDRAGALAAAEAASAALHVAGPTWFLACVGTLPEFRGRGLAGRLLAGGLAEVDAAGAAAALETSSEANVALYRRFGFGVRGEVDPPGGAPHVWVLHRPAATA